MNDVELLKYAIDHGMIDMQTMRSEIEMKNRRAILAAHPYGIFETSDHKFTTRFSDPERGTIQRKRSNREDLEDLIVAFYSTPGGLAGIEGPVGERRPKTFEQCFFEWVEQQKSYGLSGNSISRYKTDYKRFFKDTPFSEMDIEEIKTSDVTNFCLDRLKHFPMKRKSFNNFFGIIRGVFDKEYYDGRVKEQAYLRVNKRAFGRVLDKTVKQSEERILNDDQADLLLEHLHVRQQEKPEYIALYAVELAFYTGMRVGEIAALRWADVTDRFIHISVSEKYDREAKMYFIDDTKTHKDRKFPMTDDIRLLLDRVYNIEKTRDWIGEYVFSNDKGRVHCRIITECVRNQCVMLGMQTKGIHAIRRTLNSNMRRNGVPETMAASMLGHSVEVNRMHYTYDTSMMDEKRQAVINACSSYKSLPFSLPN